MANKQLRNKNRKNKTGKRGGALVGFNHPYPSFFPDRMRGTVVYSTSGTLITPASLLTANVYRLNSIYDPDYTGTGTTVRGYTQMNALYAKYRVFSATVVITAWPASTSTTDGSRSELYAVASNDLTLGVDPNAWLAQRHVYTAPLNMNSDAVIHKMVVPIHRVYGVKPEQVAFEDDFAATMTGNPNNGVQLHIGHRCISGVANTMAYTLTITYDVAVELARAYP